MPSSVSSATYDGDNRLTSWGGVPLTYDANGNLSSIGSTTFTWNARNELTATSAGSASFAYDALGRRTGATIGGTSNQYVYDGLNPVSFAGGFMLGDLGLDQVYARVSSSGSTSYLSDALNSAIALSNGSANTIATYSYSPYGSTAEAGTDPSPFQFTGRENDGATTLYYYRARYYSPEIGRFISEDPMNVMAGTNFYAYAYGNPVSIVDPLGLMGAGGGGSASHPGPVCDLSAPRLPDFFSLQLDLFVFSGWAELSRSGNLFVGGGVNRGVPNMLRWEVNLSAGWLDRSGVTSTQVDDFLDRYSGTAGTGYYGFGGGEAWSPGNGFATLAGFGYGESLGIPSNLAGAGSFGLTGNVASTGLRW